MWISPGTNILAEDDLPYLRVDISLWDSSGTNQIKLSGGESLFKDAQGTLGIFFSFPGLQITRSGSWKLGITLVGTWSTNEFGASLSRPTDILSIKCDMPTLAVPEFSPLAVGAVQVKPEVAKLLTALKAQGAQV
ncbi:protein of unknown function [Taphrina deformans PYCC 5710]|uniref:Velvet domain-containing protein n=1 Tax=Taphrina deformans (strain PYCC 5710 / ATCC 11124 / CBS 356.35 / IMI 108563 / JCM 9778 / NBRC 8474) TaxID=1097556 RepID=R4XDI4_TAPDE|nr:protein of unknown function [Taphrina deformans PYCC 5710]|eukprot:CCG83900.1 protein of unknown function [Taphrina deformans PYCC 5710]